MRVQKFDSCGFANCCFVSAYWQASPYFSLITVSAAEYNHNRQNSIRNENDVVRERMGLIMTNTLKILIHEACNGNTQCAYLAGIQLEIEGYDSFFVQSQFRRAAESNYRLAQRWLGILGLCKMLRLEECCTANAMYNSTYAPGIDWLSKASDNGDLVSSYILAKCMKLGIGIEKDEAQAESKFSQLVPSISHDEAVSVSILFDYILTHEALCPADLSKFCWALRGVPAMTTV